MYTPHSMTWYHGVKSGTTTVWTRYPVSKVMWQASEISISDKQGPDSSDSVTVFVPFSGGVYAFSKGDVLIKGIVTDEISAEFPISSLMAKYQTYVRVTKVEYKDYGTDALQHWELRGGV